MNNSQDIPVLLLPNMIDPGTYTKVTFDSKGRAILGDTLDASDIPSLFSTKISDFATAVDARITAASLQPLDADLTAIAALAPSDGTFIRRTGGTWTAAALLAADIPSLLSTAISDFSTAADARITNAIGSTVEAYDADLTAIATLAPFDGAFIRRTGGVWVASALASADIPANAADTSGTAANITGTLALAQLTDGATAGLPLLAGGAGGDPNYAALDLTQATAVTGALPVNRGGTGVATLTAHAALVGNGTTGLLTLAPGTTRNVMISDGTDWASRALVDADIPDALTISGGTVNNTVVGAITPLAITGTVLTGNSLTLNGAPGKIKPTADSTTALQIANAAGTAILTVDTANSRVGIGTTPAVAFHLLDNGVNFRISYATGLQVLTTGATAWVNLGTEGASPILAWFDSNIANLGSIGNHGIFTTKVIDSVTGVTYGLIVDHLRDGGTAAIGFGPGLLMRGTSGTAGQTREMGYMYSAWTTATDLTRAAKVGIGTYNASGTPVDVMTLDTNGVHIGDGLLIIRSVGASSLWQIAPGLGSIYLYNSSTSVSPFEVLDDGRIRIGTNFSNGDTASVHISSAALGTKGLVVRGVASQSASLQEWQASTPTTLVSIPAAGGVRLHADPGAGVASTETFTNDVSGTPVNGVTPTKWLKIYDGTTARYIPVYT